MGAVAPLDDEVLGDHRSGSTVAFTASLERSSDSAPLRLFARTNGATSLARATTPGKRKKGRDLVDLGLALQQSDVSPECVVELFAKYMDAEGAKVTRAMFEQNLAAKKKGPIFTADMTPLLAHGKAWNLDVASERAQAT